MSKLNPVTTEEIAEIAARITEANRLMAENGEVSGDSLHDLFGGCYRRVAAANWRQASQENEQTKPSHE